MLGNLAGWHMLMLLGSFVVVATVVVALVVVALSLSRRAAAGAAAGAGAAVGAGALPDPAVRIEQLARLRAEGLLSETEYEEKRQELLRRI